MSDEKKHLRALADAILTYESLPDYNTSLPVKGALELSEQLQDDLALEMQAIADYNEAIHHFTCEDTDSPITEILEHIIDDEYDHVKQIEKLLSKITKEGISSVLQSYRKV